MRPRHRGAETGGAMHERGADFYAVPTAWCDKCRENVEGEPLGWEVAGTWAVTFTCPSCGQVLAVGLHETISYRSQLMPRERGRRRQEYHPPRDHSPREEG